MVQICGRALARTGFVSDSTNDALDAGVSQAFIVDNFHVLDDALTSPGLWAMFATALMRHLPRCIDAVFIRADPAELPFWRATIGAKWVDGLIAASADVKLPDDLPSAGRRERRKSKAGWRLVN